MAKAKDSTRPVSRDGHLEKDLLARFEELAAIPESWFDEGPLDRDGLGKAHAFLTDAMNLGAPAPYVYPTPKGEVRAEWSISGWEVSAVFDLRKGSIWMHAAYLDSDAEREEALLLTAPNALNAFVAFLASFASSPARDIDHSEFPR